MNKKRIKIVRKKHFLEAGKLSKLNIFLDGNKIDSIKEGEVKTLFITQGTHSIHVGMSLCNSNSLVVDTQNTDNLELEVGTWFHGWKILLVIYSMFAPINMFYIRRIID